MKPARTAAVILTLIASLPALSAEVAFAGDDDIRPVSVEVINYVGAGDVAVTLSPGDGSTYATDMTYTHHINYTLRRKDPEIEIKAGWADGQPLVSKQASSIKVRLKDGEFQSEGSNSADCDVKLFMRVWKKQSADPKDPLKVYVDIVGNHTS